METHYGGCHCEAVRFEVQLSANAEAHRCNCSICAMVGFEHLIVPPSRFRLLKGEPDLRTYTFNTGLAKHRFCRHCGVKPFYIPRSNPDGVSVNLRCLDRRPAAVEVVDFDGRHWEQNAHRLAGLSAEQ